MSNSIHLANSNWLSKSGMTTGKIMEQLLFDTPTALNMIELVKHPENVQYKRFKGVEAIHALVNGK